MRVRPRFFAGAVAAVIASAAAVRIDADGHTPAAIRPLPKTETIGLGAGVVLEFVRVEPGSFIMGSDLEIGDADETPAHRVTLTRPFYIGKYEVTQEQWLRIMGKNPSAFKGAQQPVESVSWNDCQEFLARVTRKTGRKISLPTEAQWEYACRAGAGTRWNFGDRADAMGEYAWIRQNSGGTTHPVGQKKPNAFGIYDLYGNVAEWCTDWYANPYPKGEVTNPTGPPSGMSKIVRGGAWGDDPSNARSAYRNADGSDGANNGIGFRCVLLDESPSGEPRRVP